MTVLRVIFFRLYESPRYLVSAGRPTEAMENLQLISRFNGDELDLSLRDVRDHFGTVKSPRESLSFSAVSPIHRRSEEEQAFLPTAGSSVIFNADSERGDETTKVSGGSPDSADYNTTGETNTIRNSRYSFTTPTTETPGLPFLTSPLHSPSQLHDHGHQRRHSGYSVGDDEEDDDEYKVVSRSPQPRLPGVLRRRRSSVVSVSYKSMGWLPRFIRKPLWAYLDRIASVLAPEWIWKTLTIWAIWFSMSLGMSLWRQLVILTQPDLVGSIHDVQRVSTEIIREAVGRDERSPISIRREICCRGPIRGVVIGG